MFFFVIDDALQDIVIIGIAILPEAFEGGTTEFSERLQVESICHFDALQ